MSQYDEINASQSLAWRLREWGVDDADKKARGFIADLVTNGWIMNPQREARPQPPKAGRACWTCGRVYTVQPPCCDSPARRPEHGSTDGAQRARAVLRGQKEDA